MTVPDSLKFPQVFWKLDCYPFSKIHLNLGKSQQRSWGLIMSGHCTMGKVNLIIVWNHWFTALLQIPSKPLPSMGPLFPLHPESVFCSADKVIIFLSFFEHIGHPDLAKMRQNTTQGPNDLNMRLHISSWNSEDLIKVWRENRQKYSLLYLVGYMYYLWCRMNDWLPWILICKANEETLPLYMQCYRKVVSSSFWCGKSWIMAHFICLTCSRKVNRQSWFNNKDLQSSVGQIPLYLTVWYRSCICPVFAD